MHQAGERLARVDGVEDQPLEARREVEGATTVVRRRRVAGAETLVVDEHVAGGSGEADLRRGLRGLGRHLLVEIGTGADVDTEDAHAEREPGEQTGVGSA